MKQSGYNRIRLYAYPFFGVVMYLLFVLINPLDDFFKSYRNYKVWDYLLDFLLIIIFTAAILESGILITKVLNRFLPWEGSSIKRITLQLILQIAALTLLFATIFSVAPLSLDNPEFIGYDSVILRQAIVLGSLVSLLNTAVFTAEYFFKQWVAAKIETVQLKQNATEARLDALTTQIDPHFLFNNLSTLLSLIEENTEQAAKFVMHFTTVYRYVLAKRQVNVITLSEELSFIGAYVFLYSMRYGSAFAIDVDVHPSLYKKGIAPMTLQLLVENAVKHNSLSEAEPLNIRIYDEADWLVVQNNIQRKWKQEEGLQLGLANIKERYMLLNQPPPEITNADNLFQVKIPLINFPN